MNELKPIVTRHAGYLFRSRLEARWSLFLSRLNVEYDYEPEGFDLTTVRVPAPTVELPGKDAWYLPDFWLPAQKTWLEVKPVTPTAVEYERCARLAVASRQTVVIVVGQPWVTAERTFGYDGGDSGYLFMPDGRRRRYFLLTACPFCTRIDWCEAGDAAQLSCDCPNLPQSVGDFARIQRAYLAARSARFEHGQTPIAGGV
jgi:hypothetical protein